MCTTVATIELVDQFARDRSCHFVSNESIRLLAMDAWRIGEVSYLINSPVKRESKSGMTWDVANARMGHKIQVGTG